MSMRRALIGIGLLASLPFLLAGAQEYLDGKEILDLTNKGKYEEALLLARSRPNAYGQWAALLIWHRIAPSMYSYSTTEGYLRGYAEACQYRGANKEAEAFCYRGIIDADGWKAYPEVASLLKEIRLPELSRVEAQQGIARLEREGVPYAIYLNQVAWPILSGDPKQRAMALDENRLRPLADRYPFSLGGSFARGLWALVLWERGRYSEALRIAEPVAGAIAAAGSVLAWAEYAGQGVKQNREDACRRALFWTQRSNANPAVYTLGMCYLEGAGGFPKDPVEAYALFWLGKYLGSQNPGFEERLKELEKSLTPNQVKEGRQRAQRYLQ